MALVLAAGEGERLGAGTPKAFVPLGGTTMLALASGAAARCQEVRWLVVVVPRGWERRAESLLPSPLPLAVVTGGSSRQESVRRALEAVPSEVGSLVCHDAARPFASGGLFAAALDALREADGAVPVLPVPDTVKRLRDGIVVGTVPREELGLAQTPQAFRAEALRKAHARALADGVEGTDDAALLERTGFRVVTVPGEPGNFKVTTSDDLARAEAILAAGRASGAVEATRG